MNYANLPNHAARMAANAKNGTLKHGGSVYTFTFTPEWVYEVTDQTGEVLTRFNTKKLTVARQWLRDYLEN
jgi:hypothetical protein